MAIPQRHQCAAGAGWKTISDGSLDGTWASGNGGLGYADNANETSLCQTLLSDMTNHYTTVYLRRSFQITDTIETKSAPVVHHGLG